MKRILTIINSMKALCFVMFLNNINIINAQIYTNSFTGVSACPTNGNIPTMAASSTGTPLSRSTTTCTATVNVFNSTTLNNTSTISLISYIEFSASANPNLILNITSLSFFRQGSNSAPNKLEVQYSTDAFVTSTTWGAAPTTPTAGSVTTWDMTDFSTPLGGTVFFRIYPFGTTRADGTATAASTAGTFRVDDVTINGSVICPTANAIASTNWTTPSTWSCGVVPTLASDVTIPMGTIVLLDVNAAVNNLTFTGGGKLTLGGNSLTVNGSVTGSATAGYAVTDGTGALTQNVGTIPKIFPIGSSLMSYDQVSITNTTGTNSFSASVKPSFTITNTPSDVTKVFSREWNITSSSASANLAFTPDVASTPTPAPTVFTLGHYTNGAWVESYAGVSGGTYSGTFTSFSPFGVGQNGSFSGVVLGVELTNFIAKANKSSNLLSWQTTTEKNNAQFQIERSQNGEIFSKIGEVKGRGNSNVEQNYTFTDASPVKGINYYRLRQVDFDGTETISKTVSATFDGKGQNKFKVYPTLTQDLVNIELNEEGKTEIAVRDLTGRVILTKNTEGVSNITLNMGALSSGLYIMSVRSNEAFETVKIQKY
jgi:hypothetical protein